MHEWIESVDEVSDGCGVMHAGAEAEMRILEGTRSVSMRQRQTLERFLRRSVCNRLILVAFLLSEPARSGAKRLSAENPTSPAWNHLTKGSTDLESRDENRHGLRSWFTTHERCLQGIVYG